LADETAALDRQSVSTTLVTARNVRNANNFT
jgi:hypothetical protein